MLQLHAQISTRWVWLLGKGGAHGPGSNCFRSDSRPTRGSQLRVSFSFLSFSLHSLLRKFGGQRPNYAEYWSAIWWNLGLGFQHLQIPSGPKRSQAGWTNSKCRLAVIFTGACGITQYSMQSLHLSPCHFGRHVVTFGREWVVTLVFSTFSLFCVLCQGLL